MTLIKRLSSKGFKSFANKTDLIFGKGFNIIIGPNGAGKSLSYNSIITLSNGEEIKIGKLVEEKLKNAKEIKKLKDGIYCEESGTYVISVNPLTMKSGKKLVSKFIKRECEELFKIKTRSGKEITATGCHPIMIFKEGILKSILIKDLKSNDNFVYDISVDSTQNFIGGFGGIVLHNSEAYVLFQGMASVDGNEKIFILNDEHIKRIKIKNLEGKNLSRIKALVIDPETNEVKSLPIKSFIKHPPRKILYKIKTESGKEVKTTPDHSVFTYTDKIIPKEVKDLKIGDVIASVNVKDKIENSKLTGEKITEIKKITLKKPKDVYDISIPGYRNFVNSDGILLHNSGHPSFGTMHANSVDTMIKRLETPPINLSASLVETLDVVCVMIQTKVGGKLVRRISEVVEVIEVKENQPAVTNTPFIWNPQKDTFFFKTQSHVFKKLFVQQGINEEDLQKEFKLRTELLIKLYQKKIFDFIQVRDAIKEYYKDPSAILARFGII